MRCALVVSLCGLFLPGAAQAGADDPPSAAVEPKPADGDAPLPVGFPGATKPGTIEVKSYPAYRSAVASGEGMTTGSGDFLFWALFRHIDTKGVAMTAPVINTYESDRMVKDPGAKGRVTMEFLYGRPDLGDPGPGVGAVKVVDHPAGQYVCLGLQGRMDSSQMKAGLERLEEWLSQHKDKWVATGPARRLGYQGPMTPAAQRLWEVQIPVEAAAGEAPATETPAP